ncbi:hypothetical protein JB92DRAFT_2897379 [Gautieria morchelliformis]|nr:hypothetical protein JB92DRAFT_2897379 [Gautieria morchelliformis]
MESQTTLSGHFILLCMPAWGHLRPLCALAAKLVKERQDVAITLLIAGEDCNGQRTEREISRFFSVSEADSQAKANIRLVNIHEQGHDPFVLKPIIAQKFPGYFDKLLNCKPVQCMETKRRFDAIRKPTAVVLDYFLLAVLQHIRSVTGRNIPVYAWVASYPAPMLRIFGPEELGGFGDVPTKARTQAEATGRQLEDVMGELYNPSSGSLVNVPGWPLVYDYEFVSQERTPGVPITETFRAAYIFASECDGFVSIFNANYESIGLDATRMWLAKTNRPVYAVGPLIPPGFGDFALSDAAKQLDIASSTNGGEFQTFLDDMLKRHGERSVIYVSFGSFWWPKKNEHVWVLVDALLEFGFPFILSHASPMAEIPTGYATGWVLTHCGANSVTEALAQGIPMIAWPLDAEQPANAIHLALILDVAFEMLEVRTGQGLKPLYRGAHPTGTIEAVTAEARDILQKARGPEGERKRRNAESIRYKWKQDWEEGGDALNSLRKLLTDHCSQD